MILQYSKFSSGKSTTKHLIQRPLTSGLAFDQFCSTGTEENPQTSRLLTQAEVRVVQLPSQLRITVFQLQTQQTRGSLLIVSAPAVCPDP